MAGDHGIGLRADAGLLTQERTGRTELRGKEAKAPGFVPLAVAGVILAGGGEELPDGLVVERAVLTDIQHGHMEAERAQEAQERVQFGAGDTPGANFDESLAQE